MIALHFTNPAPGVNMWALGFFAALQVVLMYLAVPAAALGSTAKGLLSFDRLPLVAAVLLFGPLPAAWAAGGAALVLSLASNAYREPWRQRVIHALGNGGMYLLASLAAGYAWLAIGGNVPIEHFRLINIDRIAVLIITLQVTNELLYAGLNWRGMNSEARRRPVHWPTALIEFAIAWTGVAAARAYFTLGIPGFALFVLLILIIAVLLKVAFHVAEDERQRTHELTAVNHVNQAVDSATDLDELIEVIFRETRGLMEFAAFLIGLYEPESDLIDVRFNYDAGTRHPPTRRKPGEGVFTWVLKRRESVLIADTRTSDHPGLARRVITGRPAISIMAVPITFRNETIGVISVQDYRPKAFRRHHLELFESFAAQIAVAIVNTRLFAELQSSRKNLESRVIKRTAEKEALLEQMRRENRSDALCGLANRRHLDEMLRLEHYRAQRFAHPLAVAIGDIDHFKQINDRWGHALGDEVLKAIADILRVQLRATDFVARYGGEEFVILFPETPGKGALEVCEKLRSRIAAHHWNELAADLSVTMSFGISASADGGKNDTLLLAEADRALYLAKSEGRNRVRSNKPDDLIPQSDASELGAEEAR
ncbi:MAG: diguanylate cyclase [Gammaproteobacteria bacterium]